MVHRIHIYAVSIFNFYFVSLFYALYFCERGDVFIWNGRVFVFMYLFLSIFTFCEVILQPFRSTTKH